MIKNVIVECDSDCIHNKGNGYCREGYCQQQEIKVVNGICVSREPVRKGDNYAVDMEEIEREDVTL